MQAFGIAGGGGRRSAQRQTAPLLGVLTTLQKSWATYLVDVSATGARVQGDCLPGDSEEFFLIVEGVKAFGTIAWTRDDERGVTFDPPLTQGEEDKLRGAICRTRGLSADRRAAQDDWDLGLAR